MLVALFGSQWSADDGRGWEVDKDGDDKDDDDDDKQLILFQLFINALLFFYFNMQLQLLSFMIIAKKVSS